MTDNQDPGIPDVWDNPPRLVRGTSSNGGRVTYAALSEELRKLTPEQEQDLIDWLAEVGESHRRGHECGGGASER